MKKLYITGIFCALISTIHAQYVGDALRFSEAFNGGTARSVSMGGAFGALGGDFGALSSNPAGLGVYRMSEFTLSPSFYKGDVTSRYFGTSTSDYKYDFNLNNLGVVFNNTSKNESGLISTSFAIGFNRLNNFNNYYLIQGQNPSNSIGDYFLDNAYDNIGPLNPDDLDPFYERLAFDAYIIDTLSDGSGDYFTEVPLPIDQVKTLETSGGVKEWSFSF